MSKHIVYLDMDGVLADFVTAAMYRFIKNRAVIDRLLSAWPPESGLDGIYEILGVKENAFWHEVNQGGVLFWKGLPVYPWATELVDIAESIGETLILSSPSRGGSSAAGKLEWLYEKLNTHKRKFILTPKKYKHLLARPGDVLIDDDPATCFRWHQHGGKMVLFPRPWNAHPDWKDPMVAVRQVLAEI